MGFINFNYLYIYLLLWGGGGGGTTPYFLFIILFLCNGICSIKMLLHMQTRLSLSWVEVNETANSLILNITLM